MEILALIILNMFTYLIILLLRNQTPFAAPSCSFAKTLCSSCMMVIPSKDSLSLPSLPHFVDTTLTADIWHTFLLLWWPSASGVQYYSLSFLCRYLVFFCVQGCHALVLLSHYQVLMLLCDAFYLNGPFITSVAGPFSGFLTHHFSSVCSPPTLFRFR